MIADIIVIGCVAALLLLAVRKIVSDRKKGVSSCGCNCGGCSGSCHAADLKKTAEQLENMREKTK
jgi:hypothetical protein